MIGEGDEKILGLDVEEELSKGPPPELEQRIQYAANSGRFVLLWRDPLILVYLGENGDYVVVDGVYCSCEGFARRVSRRGVGGCSHVYAARRIFDGSPGGKYRVVEASLDEVVLVVWEVLTGGLTHTLRKILYLQDKIQGRESSSEDETCKDR